MSQVELSPNSSAGEPGPSSCSRRSKDNEQSECSSPGKEGGKSHSAGTGEFDRCSVFYICSLCNFSCETAVEFTIHLNSEHVQNEEYFCYHCNYRGEYTTDLTNHVSAHTAGEVNIYRCPCALESCSYRTDSLHNMRQHLATHKDSQAFRCDTCKSSFTDGIEFLHHAQQNSLTLYTCSQCASRFLEKSAIQHHWRTKHSGGLVLRVFKILLCHDRKVNGYQSSQASDNDVTKQVESHSSSSHSDQPLSAPAPVAGSSASENLEISSAAKSVSEDQTSDTKSPSDPVVRTDKPSESVLDMDSEVCASGKGQKAAVQESEDTTVSNTDVPLTENSPEPSETRRLEDENNKLVVMTIADPEVSDSSHSVVGGELETEGTEQNHNQLDHLEKPTVGTDTRLSGAIHLLIVGGPVIESKGLDSCKEEDMSNNAENDAICVSKVQAECKLSCHDDASVPKKSDSSSLSRKSDTGRTNSAGRMENSTSAVEAEVINRTGHVKNKHTGTSVTHSSVKQRHNISKKSYPSSGAVVHSNRTGKYSAVLEDTVTLASNGHAQCGVKSFNRATSVHRRKSAEEKGSRDSGGCLSSGAAKDSRNVRLLAAKPHSSAHYMQKSLQNCKMKVKTPAPPKEDRKFTVEKIGAVSKLKCKACGQMTLTPNAMFKHLEACQHYMNAQPVSEHTNAAGSLAKKMRTSISGLGAGDFTLLNSKTGQEQSKEPGSVESNCYAQDSTNLVSSLGSSEQPRISQKPLKRSSQKKHQTEKKVQESSSEKGKNDRKTVGPHAKKTKLVKTATKETGDERSADGGVSPEPNKNIDESVRLKNVEDNHTPEETDHEHVKSADDQSDVEMSEEDIKPRRSRKRRCTWRLESSSDEYDSEDQIDSKRDVEKSEEEEIKDDFEQLSECKLCGFAAPSSQVHELRDHLHSKHQRLTSLIKCGHCGQPYGNLTILKRHINSIHPGQPELQEQVPYHEFFKLQEKENCSPQKRLEQLVNRIRSEPRIKQRRVQKRSGSGLITAGGVASVLDSEEFGTFLKFRSLSQCAVSVPPGPEDAAGMRSDSASKPDICLSERKDAVESGVPGRQGQASAQKCKPQGSLDSERGTCDGKNIKTSSERYRCVKCSQVQPDYRSMLLHLSRHLDLDYSLLRCDLCSMEFTVHEAHMHYSKMHPGKSAPDSWVCDAKAEEKLLALVKASKVEGSRSCEADKQELPGKKGERRKQSIQCCLCQALFDSLNQFRKHSMKDHGIENDSSKMHWQDSQSQTVYDLGGNIVQASVLEPVVFNKRSGYSSWRFVNRYRCVMCSQVQPDYRSMLLHLSRHLNSDYSLLRCDLCSMEFITTREAHMHYSKMHPGKSAPDSWVVCDAKAKEELLALVKASKVEGSCSCEADKQELPGKKGESRKQSIQCCLCQALFDSLNQFRKHSMKDHGIENDSSKMHWQDSQSQTVYDLGGNIVQASVLEPVVFNKLCGYCSWRFVNSEAAASHARAKHPDRKLTWIVMLRYGVNCLKKSRPSQAKSLASATTSQKETSKMKRCGTSSESSGNGSPDAGEVSGEAGNGLQGRGLNCPKLREGPAIVLKDFLKTHQIHEFKRLLQSNGITAFYLGVRLSPEAQAFLMRFAPE